MNSFFFGVRHKPRSNPSALSTQHSALLLLLLSCASAAAMSDAELHERVMLNSRQDNAQGASVMSDALIECSNRIGILARNPVQRRAYELLLCDIQDVIAKMSSPEAFKFFAASLPRLPVDGLVTLCYACKDLPPNADIDLVAQRMLVSGMDFRARSALTDLLGAHKVVAARDKLALGLNPLENVAVQISTCRALAQIPDKKSVPDLIKYLGALPVAKGRFGFEAVCALRALTGQDFGIDPSTWQHWWAENQKSFAPAAGTPDWNYELSEKQDVYYYEVPVVENRLVLVLDTSGSMIMGGKPSRIESLKTEAKNLISALNEKKLFNLVAFSSQVHRWRKEGLVAGTAANKKEALAFIDSLRAEGGTQTMLAMEDVLYNIAVVNGCECVYLVTDGNPNPWATNIVAEQQERLLRWLNRPLKVRINTIGIYSSAPEDAKRFGGNFKEDLDKMQKFLMDIASNNDGVYRELGKDGTNKVVKVDPKKDAAMKDKKVAGKDDPKDMKKDDAKKEEPKKDEMKKDEPKKEEPPKEEPKKEEPTKEEPKKDDPKPTDPPKKPAGPPESDKDIDLIVKVRPEEPAKDETKVPDNAPKKPAKDAKDE